MEQHHKDMLEKAVKAAEAAWELHDAIESDEELDLEHASDPAAAMRVLARVRESLTLYACTDCERPCQHQAPPVEATKCMDCGDLLLMGCVRCEMTYQMPTPRGTFPVPIDWAVFAATDHGPPLYPAALCPSHHYDHESSSCPNCGRALCIVKDCVNHKAHDVARCKG